MTQLWNSARVFSTSKVLFFLLRSILWLFQILLVILFSFHIKCQQQKNQQLVECGVWSDQVDFILEAMKCCFFLNIKSIFTSQWIKQIKCIYRKNFIFSSSSSSLYVFIRCDVCFIYRNQIMQKFKHIPKRFELMNNE